MLRVVLSFLLMTFTSLANAADFPVTISSCGKPVTFTAPPERAVIHDLNMTEMAFALHLQERIVGITGITGWYKMTPEFKRQMGNIPELAPKYPTPETLLAVSPDFFFAGWNYGMKPGGDVTPETLNRYGIKTFVLSESCAITGEIRRKADMNLLYGDMLTLGKIFGKDAEAERLVASWQARLRELPLPPTGQKRLKVFVYDSGEDKPFTSGKYAMPEALINAAGGVNAMGNLDISWGTTSWESVAMSGPDLIILLDYQTGRGADDSRRFLESHPLMKLTPAVKNQRYLKLQYAELTPGPANIHAVEKLANALYGGRD